MCRCEAVDPSLGDVPGFVAMLVKLRAAAAPQYEYGSYAEERGAARFGDRPHLDVVHREGLRHREDAPDIYAANGHGRPHAEEVLGRLDRGRIVHQVDAEDVVRRVVDREDETVVTIVELSIR